MNKVKGFTGLSTAALLTAAMSSTAFATSGDEAETIIKDNTVQSTNVRQNTHVNTNTRAQAGALSISGGGHAYSAGGEGGQGGQGGAVEQEIITNATGGAAEQEQGQLQGQGQQQNATGGAAEQEQLQGQEQSSNNENDNSNGGQDNRQSTVFNGAKHAASGSSATVGDVYVPNKCMDGWGFSIGGASFTGSAAFGFTKINPAGVDLGGLTLRDYADLTNDPANVEGAQTKFEKRADATQNLDETEQEKLTCLIGAIEAQEDLQSHEIEVLKMNQDFELFRMYAEHALKNDGPNTGKVDEASITEHAVITMAIAQRNPEIMLWLGAFSEMDIDGKQSATQVIRSYMKDEINYDFKAEANKTILNMFAPK